MNVANRHLYFFLVFVPSIIIQCCAIEDNNGEMARELASLAQKWNITEGTVDYSQLEFKLYYTVSDFILDDMITYKIYNNECQEGNVLISDTGLDRSLLTDDTPPGDGEGFRTAHVKTSIKTETITSDPDLYSEETVNGELIAAVSFCVRFSLWTPFDPPIEVNFLETIVTLKLDLTAGFNIDNVVVKPNDKSLNSATDEYSLQGFLCDDNNLELSDAEIRNKRSQGSVVRVCVTPDETARQDSIFMKQIDSFSFTRIFENTSINPRVNQVAVENGKEASNSLTNLDCEPGMLICAFETILYSAFYRFPGTVEGSGVGQMQFGDATLSRRGLRSQRGLQENRESVTNQFNIDIETVPQEDGFVSSSGSFNSVFGCALMVTFFSIVLSM